MRLMRQVRPLDMGKAPFNMFDPQWRTEKMLCCEPELRFKRAKTSIEACCENKPGNYKPGTLVLFVQAGDKTLADFDVYPGGYFQGDDVFVDRCHLTVNAGGGDHQVSLFQCIYKRPVFLGLFLLGPDQQEIEDAEHENKRHQIHDSRLSSAPPGR